jgi:hypothetical protein
MSGERQATVRKDLWRDETGNEFTQYTIKYADGSGEFVRIPVEGLQEVINRALRKVDRALPAKTSIVETQTKEAAAPALKVIDSVRQAIKESMV